MNRIIQKYKTVLLCLIAAIGFQVVGCKDFLDIKSNANLTTPNNLESFQKLLDNANDMNLLTSSFGEISADDYFVLDKTFNSFKELNRGEYIWDWIDYNYPNDWARGYVTVYNSNLILDQLRQIQKSKTNALQYEQIEGAALFYRSFAFLNLLWTYAPAWDESSANEMGIVLRETSNPDVVSKRSTVAECYAKVIVDLTRSASLLPALSQHVLRPSKAAAMGILARAYLSMRAYDKAYLYADSALMKYSVLMDYNTDNEVVASADYPFTRYNKETIFYAETSNSISNGYIDTMLVDQYQTNDLRKRLYFRPVGNYHTFKGSYSGKFTLFSGLTTGELLLIKAESAAVLGKYEDARKTLKELLIKRYKTGADLGVDAVGDAQVLAKIRIERRKELLFRALRWIDIKRYNLEGADITIKRRIGETIYELQANDPRFALPLPSDVLLQTGMTQNPR